MTHFSQSNEQLLLRELQDELGRLTSERARAIKKRDRVFAVVETGDDTGHSLNMALIRVKRIDERIEQVKNLIAKQQQRVTDGV